MSGPERKIGICVLFEGRYAEGAAALLNSLHAAGFRGRAFCGFRGEPPPWLGAGPEVEPAPGLRLHPIRVGNARPLVMQKAEFALAAWDGPAADCEALVYFDADILLLAEWRFFEDWVRHGLAVCADVNAEMPAGHPIRARWKTIFGGRDGAHPPRALDLYFNAGFFGLERSHRGFLERWKDFVEVVERELAHRGGGPLPRTEPLAVGDQDAFNAALMLGGEPLSPMGRDGMGFQAGGGNYVMTHAIGPAKPWNQFLLRNALRRRRPTLAERQFVHHLDGPIPLYSPLVRSLRRLDLAVARVVGAGLGT